MDSSASLPDLGLISAPELLAEGSCSLGPQDQPTVEYLVDLELERWSDIPSPERISNTDSPVYQQLQVDEPEIRLLQVLPGPKHGDVCCRMTTHLLRDGQSYRALSYTWGKECDDCHIRINGQCVPVRKNLWRFLKQIRKRPVDYNQHYWIDALCINQSSIEERGSQVRLMGEIYRNALEVVVWLGPAYEGSDLAMKACRTPRSQWPSKSHVEASWWSAVHRLCERRYWTRLWVLQELVLARRIVLYCGSQQAFWETLLELTDMTSTYPETMSRRNEEQYDLVLESSATRMIAQVRDAKDGSSLYSQIIGAAPLECSNPLDKVYAVLGIVHTGHESIIPDYSLTVGSLLNSVLRNESHLRPLTSLSDLYKRCELIADAASIDIRNIFDLQHVWADRRAPSLDEMRNPSLVDESSSIDLWWTYLGGHDSAIDLWVREQTSRDSANVKLLAAVDSGNTAACELLLEFGKFGNHESPAVRDAFCIAAKFDDTTMLDVFLRRSDINPRARGTDGLAPLDVARSSGKGKAIERLIDRSEADLNAHLASGQHYALSTAVDTGIEAIVRPPWQNWLENDFRSSESVDSYNDIIFSAAKSGFDHIVDMLVCEEYMDALRIYSNVSKFLLHAISERQDRVALCLLARPELRTSDINCIGEYITPLTLAIYHDRTAIARALLLRPDLDIRLKEHMQIADYKWGHPLMRAMLNKNKTIFKLLLEHQDVNPNEEDLGKRSPLMFAIHKNLPWALDLLLQREDLDPSRITSAGDAVLHYAIEQNQPWAVKMLLECERMDLTQCSRFDDSTPLEHAIRLKADWAVKMLLECERLDPTQRNPYGFTPLQCAMRLKADWAVKMLLECERLDPTQRTTYGLTPIEYATKLGEDWVIEMISKRLRELTPVNS